MSFYDRPVKINEPCYPRKWWERESDEPIPKRNELLIDGKAYPNIKVDETNLTSPTGE